MSENKDTAQEGKTMLKESEQRTLEPVNEFEKLLIQLHDQEVSSEEFLGALFNGPVYILTSEDQIDQKKKRLVDNPRLFTLFGDKKQPYLSLFTDKNRARPVQEKEESFNVLLQVPVGDLLSGTDGVGIVVNPFWDKHARWEPEQIAAFKNLMRREESGLWVRIPDSELITVYGEKGQPVKLQREQFRKEVLPKQLEALKDKPEQLYNIIITAINDGFATDILESAQHLYATDTIKERGTVALGVALMQNGELDKAEDIFKAFLTSEGKSAVILTNLAKLYEKRDDKDKRFELLVEALNINPNLDNALEWYCEIINNEKGGQEEIIKALDELEGLAGSWRPALLLGRAKIMDGKVQEAVEHYTDALEVDGHSADTLLLATSELGQLEHHEEVINLGLAHYNVQRDDPRAGLNVLQACLHTNQPAKGLELCETMLQIPVPDLQNVVGQFKEKLEAL